MGRPRQRRRGTSRLSKSTKRAWRSSAAGRGRRDLVGRLSRRILDHGAATVVLDMMFPQEDGANDEVLAECASRVSPPWSDTL